MQDLNIDSSIPPHGQWQWHSNKDPWLKGQEMEWTSYSPEQNALIEEAYYEQKKEVDIGDYIISIQNFVQKKKGSVVSQRKIRRIKADGDEEMKWREERYFDTELPKTVNNIFGSVEDLRKFITQRNHAGLWLWENFDYIMDEKNLEILNQYVIPILLCSLREEFLNSKEGVSYEQKNSLFRLFEQKFEMFEEFYSQIMKAYTLDTFLYRNINQYLRNEDWNALDSLILYMLCLFTGIERLQKKAKMDELMKENSKDNQSMLLYRGTRMDKDSLDLYSLAEFTNFSWYSITSATTNKKIAQRFLGIGKNDGKIPVFFKIEVPLITQRSNTFYLNVKPFSDFKGEDEVIFAPGCIFNVKDVVHHHQGQKIFSEINLRLITKIDDFTHAGFLMPGKMQKTHEKGFFEGLSGSMISKHLIHYTGNELMKEIEFKDCIFNEECFEILVTLIFPKMPSLRKLTFNFCSIECTKGLICEAMTRPQFPFSKIQEIELFEKNDFFKTLLAIKHKNLSYWGSLTSLTLDLTNSQKTEMTDRGIFKINKTTDEDINRLCLQVLQHLTQLTLFNLKFSMWLEITDEGLKVLFTKGLWHLIHLKSLSLSVAGSDKITDKAVSFIYFEGLPCMNKLESLKLDFISCNGIRGQVKNENCQLESLPQLTSLALDFSSCGGISEQGVDLYFQIFPNSNQLKSLKKLELSFFESLTDEGLQKLYYEAFQHLCELKSLHLCFSCCSEITDQGISFLRSNKIKPLKHLEDIFINLFGVPKITKEEGERLRSVLAVYPKYSKSWLEFYEKSEMENSDIIAYGENFSDIAKWSFERIIEPMEEDADDGFQQFNYFHFPAYRAITHEIIRKKFDHFFSIFSEAKTLGLIFETRSDNDPSMSIPDTLEHIVLEQFQHFSQVKYLSMNFKETNITDKSIELLASEGFKHFGGLLELKINFKECKRITNESIKHLVTKGFRLIPQLKYLNLNFKQSRVSYDGLKILAHCGIKQLTELRHLKLNFSECIGFFDFHQYPERLEGLGFKLIDIYPQNEEILKDNQDQEDEEEGEVRVEIKENIAS